MILEIDPRKLFCFSADFMRDRLNNPLAAIRGAQRQFGCASMQAS